MQIGFVGLLISLLALGAAQAQEPMRAPDGGTSSHVSGVDLLPVPGRPFTAKSRIDWVRLMQDGTGQKQHLDSNLARDSQGRMYRERRGFAADGNSESPLRQTLVYDPVASTKTTCTPALRRCVTTSYHPRTPSVALPTGAFANGTRYLTREQLGRDKMDGLDVTGTRETVTTNPGVVGNEKPLVATKEFWYSPELETNLFVKRSDPRVGVQLIQLSGLSRSEPDPRLFAVPKGFAVTDARGTTGPSQEEELEK